MYKSDIYLKFWVQQVQAKIMRAEEYTHYIPAASASSLLLEETSISMLEEGIFNN